MQNTQLQNPLESKIETLQSSIDNLETYLTNQNCSLQRLITSVSGDKPDSLANQVNMLTGLIFDLKSSVEEMRVGQQNQLFSAFAAALLGIAVGTGIVFSHAEVPIARYLLQIATFTEQR